jgi:hypothetical protein
MSMKVTGDRDANDGDLLRRWAIEGAGVVLKSAWDVAHDLRAGRLEALLVPFCPVEVDLQIVLPPGGRRPRRVDFVCDHLAAMLRQLDQCLDDVGLGSLDVTETAGEEALLRDPDQPAGQRVRVNGRWAVGYRRDSRGFDRPAFAAA